MGTVAQSSSGGVLGAQKDVGRGEKPWLLAGDPGAWTLVEEEKSSTSAGEVEGKRIVAPSRNARKY